MKQIESNHNGLMRWLMTFIHLIDRDYRLSNNGTNGKIANIALEMHESLAFDLHYDCSTLPKLSLPL